LVCRAAAALAGVGLARYLHEGQGEAGALFRAVLTATVAAVERRRVGGRAQMMRNHKLKFHSHGSRERTAGKEGDAILEHKGAPDVVEDQEALAGQQHGDALHVHGVAQELGQKGGVAQLVPLDQGLPNGRWSRQVQLGGHGNRCVRTTTTAGGALCARCCYCYALVGIEKAHVSACCSSFSGLVG